MTSSKDDVDGDDLEYQERQDRPSIREAPLAVCCEKGQRLIVLSQSRNYDEFELVSNFIVRLKANPPRWHVAARDGTIIQGEWDVLAGYISQIISPHIEFCPFCGVPVPKIVWNDTPPSPICLPTNGYYCGQCEERLMCCECWPVENFWKIAQ